MQAKKFGAIALAGTAFGTVVSPAFAPIAGAQTDAVTAAAEEEPTTPSCTTTPCLTIEQATFLSLIAGILSALSTLVAP